MAESAIFERREKKGSSFPSKDSYNPVNHIGGYKYKEEALDSFNWAKEKREWGMVIVSEKKRIRRKTRITMNPVLM